MTDEKTKYTNLLIKASQIKGLFSGTLKGILTWENVTEKQKVILRQILEQCEKIELVPLTNDN